MNPHLAQSIYKIASRFRDERTFSYLEEYHRTQWQTPQEIAHYQSDRIGELIDYAHRFIPFYRDIRTFDLCPVVYRRMIKERSTDFTSSGRFRHVTRKVTAGSTGEPLVVWKDNTAMAREQAITYRGYSWAGVFPGDRQARFWGIPLNKKNRRNAAFKDLMLNRTRYSAFSYTDAEFGRFFESMRRRGQQYVYGYASLISQFADFLIRRGTSLDNVKAAITTAEMMTPEMRASIQSGLKCHGFSEYGATEVGSIAHEADDGTVYINAENLLIEVIDDEGLLQKEGTGAIVVTELHNRYQPLIRYYLGDVGEIAAGHASGKRGLPVLKALHGREHDCVIGPNGRRYHPLFFAYIMEEMQKFGEMTRQYQLVQNERQLTFRIVKGMDFKVSVEQEIRNVIEKEFGTYFTCTYDYYAEIPREPSGKFRQVKRISP